MNRDDKKTLELFQCEFNRALEEDFAQILSERSDVRLFFIRGDQAFTDGKNIVVDPAYREIFADIRALRETERHLKLDNTISGDRWLALRMMTRALNIHETLHILYSPFPNGVATDPRATSKVRKLVLHSIWNIIEDAFIEAVGCSVYDNLEQFLLWFRVAVCCANAPAQGTIRQAFSELPPPREDEAARRTRLIVDYLCHVGDRLLYPMAEPNTPDPELLPYIQKTWPLFEAGAVCGQPDQRYAYTQRIFDIIEPLVPEGADLDLSRLHRMLPGGPAPRAASIRTWRSRGKTAAITRRLFTSADGKPVSFDGLNAVLRPDLMRFLEEKDAALSIVTYTGSLTAFTGGDFDCANIHKGITLEVERPRIHLNLKKAYQNIYAHYRMNIASYNTRFSQLLRGAADVREDRHLFGSGISSRRLGDVKKRYWFRKARGTDVPDIAILLLIDGSGSMADGGRRDGAIIASVILHEVLRKNGIEHAVVEHRAIYGAPVLRHNILVGFNARAEEKYNLLTLKAEEGTREGLTLYWAERYLQKQSLAENKLIIMLSDGVPAHGLDDDSCYLPPVSIQDTRNAARKIAGRGTQIVAVALDAPGADDCYRALREIYPSVVSCTDLKRLTGQLLGLVSKGLA